MAKKFYVGVVERGLNGSYGVYFPDLPGCVSAGMSLEETIDGGREALALHLEAMADHGIAIPEPTKPEAFDADEFEGSDVHSLINYLVETDERPEREPAQRLNITMQKRLVERVDAAAAEFGFDRSGLLSVAARQWLAQNVKGAVS